MKNVLKFEEIAVFSLSIYLLTLLDVQLYWWAYPLLYLAPDISMLGYLVNNKVGAITYNIGHHKAVAVIVVVLGLLLSNDYLLLSGIILFGHSAMDRIFGYGLKYFSGFKNTHLGVLK
ncbi:MAG: DUF4260 domain-containing protein [Flavipsychrobacter sp.]